MYLVVLALGCGLALAAGLVTLRLLKDQHVILRALCSLGAIWTVLSTMWVGTLGMLYVFLVEPWPLSLRQGPDTPYARARLERILGEAPPESVTEVYCREEWGFGGDTITSIRFSFVERSTVAKLVQELRLERVPEPERAGVRYLDAPGWWPPESRLDALAEVYRRSGVDFLWVDDETGEVFYQHANF